MISCLCDRTMELCSAEYKISRQARVQQQKILPHSQDD